MTNPHPYNEGPFPDGMTEAGAAEQYRLGQARYFLQWQEAMNEAKAWADRYRHHSELSAIVEAIAHDPQPIDPRTGKLPYLP